MYLEVQKLKNISESTVQLCKWFQIIMSHSDKSSCEIIKQYRDLFDQMTCMMVITFIVLAAWGLQQRASVSAVVIQTEHSERDNSYKLLSK